MTQLEEPWLVELHKEWISCKGCEEGVVEYDFGVIIRDLLSHKCNAADAVKKIDTYYWDRSLDSGPLFKYHPDVLGGVQNILYEIILYMAEKLPYNDDRQDVLVQLILELQNIPARPVKAWNGEDRFAAADGMFPGCLDNHWRGAFPGNVSRDQLAKEPLRVKQQFDEWVNISSFIARCMEHRIEVDFPGAGKYQSIDICNGLREEHPAGIERDTYVMVAAQYILLALTFIDDRVVAFTAKQGAMNLGRDKFQLWGAKLAQLANDGDLRPDVKAAVIEARQKLVSLHPEFFEG